MRRLFVWSGLLLFAWGVMAQSPEPLTVTGVEITTQTDAFGVKQQVAIGTVVNNTDQAYTDMQITAEVFGSDNAIIGEGLGFLVNTCGKNVPLDFALQPNAGQRFVTNLDLYESDVEIDEIRFTAQGRPTTANADAERDLADGITLVSEREIAGLEWVVRPSDPDDETSPEVVAALLFGEGCYRDVFTAYDWFEYDLTSGETVAVEHPRADEALNPETLERLELTDEALFRRSYLSFAPNGGNRLVHQDRINTLITAEPNGTFRRILDEELFRSTLQGIYWLPDERFMAYYYGAYGDGVTYLIASTAGAYFSTPERFSVPSTTVPGVFPDVSNVIISGVFDADETSGYYLKPPAAERFDLLFAWDKLPGNNYPPPVYRPRGGLQVEDVIYVALPDENDQARLHCYDRRDEQLFDLAPLPIDLGTEDRANMILSPAGGQIALSANGVNGGLWLLDLSAFDACWDA